MRLLAAVAFLVLLSFSALAREFSADLFPPLSDAEATFREARALEEAGDPTASTRYRVLLKDARFPFPDAVRAALARLSSLPEAAVHWRAILEQRPASPYAGEARRGLARAALAAGRLADAERLLRDLVAAARGDEERASALARLLPVLDLQARWAELGRVARTLWIEYPHRPEARAAEAYLRLEAADPASLFSDQDLLKQGLLLLDRGSREEAAARLSALRARLPSRSPLAPQAALALGKALFYLRRYGDAEAVLAEARSAPDLAEEARYFQARSLFGANRGDEGARDLVRLARAEPQGRKSPDYLSQASRVLAGRNLWRGARRAENLVLRRYPRSSETREVRWAQGWRAYREGRYAEAAERFWAITQTAPRDLGRAQALYWQGRALAQAGEVDTARRTLEGLLTEFPLGYYARLAQEFLDRGRGDLAVADARSSGARELAAPTPRPEDPAVSRPEELARAAGYLRLNQPEAARAVLRSAGGSSAARSRLQYWAEDFYGALATSGRTWLDWPSAGEPEPLDPAGLAYPLAFPRSTTAAAREAGVHPHLVLAIAHTESHFDPRTHSSAEARGLMQFIPSTGRLVASAAGLSGFQIEDLYDPGVSLRLGARHLRELLNRFQGDVVLAAAAYNAGAGAVERWRAEYPNLEASAFVESIPYKETRRYVKKVLTALDAYGRLDPPGLWRVLSP
jgi:soluble lytic murein transglycosylase